MLRRDRNTYKLRDIARKILQKIKTNIMTKGAT